jgi:hypothetical protein
MVGVERFNFIQIMIMSKEKEYSKTHSRTERRGKANSMEDVKDTRTAKSFWIINGVPVRSIGKFLTNLKDGKELSAVRCSVTSKVFLPPQGWSPYANKKMTKFERIVGSPTLKNWNYCLRSSLE